MSAEETKIPCGCFAAWTDDDHWEITSSSSHCDHNQFDRIDGAAPPTEKGWSIGRVPSDEGGPGHEETYWLRQKLQASIVHLRDIEDYFRMSGTPRSMDRADRARSLYEQISEDFVNGKTNRLTMRQRAEVAEADNRAMQQEADEMEARVAALIRNGLTDLTETARKLGQAEARVAELEAALDAAEWYIENIEAIKEGRVVRGLSEAQSAWHNVRAAVASPGPELPLDLERVLRDPSIIVPQDQAVFEAVARWKNAPSDTASASPDQKEGAA